VYQKLSSKGFQTIKMDTFFSLVALMLVITAACSSPTSSSPVQLTVQGIIPSYYTSDVSMEQREANFNRHHNT
jgi:hypothetical protein